MQRSRLVVGAVVLVVALAALGLEPLVAQSGTPRLTKPQQAALEALIAAVDRAGADPASVTPSEWQTHVLRASDGSHYVALRALAPGVAAPREPVMLYLRLAARHTDVQARSTPQRSAVMEWLHGERSDPLPMRATRSMTVPHGEMPVGSAAASIRNPDGSLANPAVRLMDRDRQRVVREREEREKQRRAALEAATRTGVSPMLPFEDFDAAVRLSSDAGGVTVLRSVSAGPGDYVLSLAWAEPATGARSPVVHVLSHRLLLPAASPAFALSDVVLADAVHQLDAAYPLDRQNAHPYAIGALEATPARDAAFRVDERLSVAVQVINPSAGDTGKPDVEVTFAVSRLTADRAEVVGTLPPQRYTAATLPVDFDLAKGHPLFPAVQASLAKFSRGHYRLEVTAIDHLVGQRASREARFEVVGTPQSLLSEAPAPGRAFQRGVVLTPGMLEVLSRAMTPAMPSDGLTQMLGAAAAGRFAELARDVPVPVTERATAQALRALGLLGAGDSPRTVAVQLQQALAQGAPPSPILVLLGATAALGGDNRAAVSAWNQARDGGVDDSSVAALLVNAYMRQGDVARATAMAQAALDAQPDSVAAARGLAAARIAAGQYVEALAALEPFATGTPDPDTDFLVVHALYAGFVGETAPGATAAGRDRLQAVGRRYVDTGGPHAALVKEWLVVVATSARPPVG